MSELRPAAEGGRVLNPSRRYGSGWKSGSADTSNGEGSSEPTRSLEPVLLAAPVAPSAPALPPRNRGRLVARSGALLAVAAAAAFRRRMPQP